MNGYPFKPSDWSTEGRPILRIQDLSGSNADPNRFDGEIDPRYLIRRGDILISWSASLGIYRWSGEDAWLNQHIFKVDVDRTRLREEFFVWLAVWFIAEMDREVHGSTMQHLTADAFGGFPVLLPPDSQQRAIADYLDRETARIDALVAAKERVLALLAEKRRALITRAVTRGLNPHAPLRDSGIPWLGEIPAHWETVALRFLVDFTSGATPDTGRPEYWDGEIPWVSPKDMKRDEIADAEDHISDLALSKGSLRLIAPGAVLIVVRGMILAHSFPAAVTTAPVTINQDMKALRCRESLAPHFLRDFVRGHEEHVVSLADSSAHGTRKLETEVLGRLEVALPPAAEQREIIAHIADATRRIDALRVATESTIALLKERRAALIAAAVTGQIDVEATP
jgi:type I restriction enzyme S subunit